MNLPSAPFRYAREIWQSILNEIFREDQRNLKRDKNNRIEGDLTIMGRLGVGTPPTEGLSVPRIIEIYKDFPGFVLVRHTNPSTTGNAAAEFQVYNNSIHGAWGILGPGYTPDGPYRPNVVYFYAQALTTMAFIKDGTDPIEWWFGNTKVMELNSSGVLSVLTAQNAVISPAQITADQDNYNPTGLATANVLRLSTDAARTITGIAAQTTGRTLKLFNIGSFGLTLANETTSTAANRFAIGANALIAAGHGTELWYDATSSRWRIIGRSNATFG
jgi:hypothetical protein